MKKNERSLGEIQDPIKCTNIYVTGAPEEQERDDEA